MFKIKITEIGKSDGKVCLYDIEETTNKFKALYLTEVEWLKHFDLNFPTKYYSGHALVSYKALSKMKDLNENKNN